MGWKLDFDDCSNRYSMKVRQAIINLAESWDGYRSMRHMSRETGIPRRTLHRYLLEYTKYLDSSWPDYSWNGDTIDYDQLMLSIRRLIRDNAEKHQRRRW
jgi:hypothetical protein